MIFYVLGLSLCYSLCVAQSNMTEGTADATSKFGIQSTYSGIHIPNPYASSNITSNQSNVVYLSKRTEVNVCQVISTLLHV